MNATRQWILGIGATFALAACTEAADTTGASSPSPGSAPVWNPETFQKPSDADLRRSLAPLQYAVTQHADTERPFDNAYWNNEQAGIYVDVVSGEPLFSSLDKFDSGTGWPSFTRPLDPANIKRNRRPPVLHGAHGGPLGARELTSRPRLRRRPAADPPALVHELGLAALHPGRSARGGRLRAVLAALRKTARAAARDEQTLTDGYAAAIVRATFFRSAPRANMKRISCSRVPRPCSTAATRG